MPKIKNISGGPLDVPLLNRTVADGETVDAPDYQQECCPGCNNPLPIVWPANRWEPVTDTKTSKKADQ
jgi:hypothetical protein